MRIALCLSGIVGKFAVQVGLPSTLSRKESTGAYYIFQKTTKQYAANLSGRINDFMLNPTHRKSKLDYGWNDIIKDVHELIDYLPQSFKNEHGPVKTERMMMRFFILSTYGDASDNTIIRFNEKLGDFEIGDNYIPSGEFYDKQKTEPIFTFAYYTP